MSAIDQLTADQELNASGLSCPLPVLKTRKALSALETGQTLLVLSTDKGSKQDIASFCKQTGNMLVSQDERDGRYEFLIRKQ